MADSKIVTKKTAAKPAAPTETKGTSAEADKKVAAKKTAPAAAKPAPTPPPAPAKPVMSRAAAAAAAAKAATSPPPAETKAPAPAPAPAKKAPARKPPGSSADEKGVTLEFLATVTTERRLEMIREAAYYKAEKRHFEGGSEADDWAAAEREIDELLAKARQIYGG